MLMKPGKLQTGELMLCKEIHGAGSHEGAASGCYWGDSSHQACHGLGRLLPACRHHSQRALLCGTILLMRVLTLGLLCPLQANLAPIKGRFGHSNLH